MLTDYHVHLRADDDDRPPDLEAFTAENAERYLEAAAKAGVDDLGCSEHVYRFSAALDVWRHPFWEENATDDLDAYCEFVRTTPLKLGLEVDHVPGREDRLASLLDGLDLDYALGSVHFIGDRAVDHEGWDVWDPTGDPDEVWRRYFEALAEAARSRLFDILAHPDLVKVWGAARPSPRRDPRFYYEPAVEAIAEVGVAVEVSTAGLRKPVGELYPAPALVAMLVDAGAPFVLSSDAHSPGDVGHGYEATVETMRGWGIDEIVTLERRRRTMEPLG
jgi:histidinol-phosphatase (PHP family)